MGLGPCNCMNFIQATMQALAEGSSMMLHTPGSIQLLSQSSTPPHALRSALPHASSTANQPKCNSMQPYTPGSMPLTCSAVLWPVSSLCQCRGKGVQFHRPINYQWTDHVLDTPALALYYRLDPYYPNWNQFLSLSV